MKVFFFGIPEAKHVGPILVVISIRGGGTSQPLIHIFLLEFPPFFQGNPPLFRDIFTVCKQ